MKKILPHWLYRCLPARLTSLMLVLLSLGCRQSTAPRSTEEYAVVQLYGNEGIANFTKSNILYSSLSTPVSAGAFTVAPGDLVAIGGWVLPWNDSMAGPDHTVRFTEQDGLLWLNGEVAGLAPESDTAAGDILASMDTASIRRLRILGVNGAWVHRHSKALQHIASLQPRLNLMVDSMQQEQLATLLQWFDPAFLMLHLQPGQTSLLASEPQLQHLVLHLEADTLLLHDALPALPALEQLAMQPEETDTIYITPHFLVNNPQIKKLTITNLDQPDLGAILQPLKSPQELVLMSTRIDKKDILPFAGSLERLLVDSSTWQTDMPRLRWATHSADDGQAVLDQLMSSHPNLEVLELFDEDSSININSVTKLRQLHSLVLVDADSLDLAPLKSMTHLKLLSYSSNEKNDDSTLRQLKTWLPNAMVVPNEGFCLGSGWLVLLAGGLLGVIAMANRRHNKSSARPHHAN